MDLNNVEEHYSEIAPQFENAVFFSIAENLLSLLMILFMVPLIMTPNHVTQMLYHVS